MDNLPQTDRLLGQVLDGRFRLDRLLGAGGMGKVYAGHQLSVERAVAIKVLREELSESETLAQRFFREARVVASLRHANIVGLVEFGRDDERGLLYIAMEYVDGTSLGDLLRVGRLDAALTVTIARQICSALAEAHAVGVVHRDLKPDNVMLVTTAEGALTVKVLDFGIALPTGEEARLTSTGTMVGTPHYMAPEQSQDKPVTGRADIYSLGVVMYEMLSGRLPFVGDTPMSVLLKAITQAPPPLSQVLEPTEMPPPELVQLLGLMMGKEAEQRPASIAVVAQQLDEIAAKHALTPPRIQSGARLESLVIASASDEFVSAETAASPAPLTPGRAAPVVIPTAEAPPRPSPAPTLPERQRFKKRWLLLPILPLFCCCLVLGAPKDKDKQRPAAAVDVAADRADVGQSDAAAGREATPDMSRAETVDAGAPEPPTASAKSQNTTTKKKKKTVRRTETSSDAKSRPPPRDLGKAQMAAGGICQLPRCDFLGTERPGAAVCEKDSDCTAKCPISGCPQNCNDEANCRYSCDGGGCTQLCSGQADCHLTCNGGNCQQRCLGQANCDMSCNGGNCQQQCLGQATCKKSCARGNCKG